LASDSTIITALVGGGDHQVEFAFLDLLLGRVEDILTALVADARGADRAHERHARDGEGGRRGDHRQHVRLVLAVIAQHVSDDVDLVVKAFGEEGADRTVDKAAGESLLLGGAALALEEAARNASSGGEFFLIVDGQREEILPRLHVLRGGHRAQDDGVAQTGQHGAVGLTRNAPGFEGEGLSAPLDFNFLGIEHVVSFERPRPDAAGASLVRDSSRGSDPNGPGHRPRRIAGIRNCEAARLLCGKRAA
jgi:hypothetical protein